MFFENIRVCKSCKQMIISIFVEFTSTIAKSIKLMCVVILDKMTYRAAEWRV